MKAKQLFANDAMPSEDDLERYYAAGIILQKKALAYACMAHQLEIIWTRKVPTAGTDSVHIYINPDFFLSLPNDEQRAFLLAHEVGHVCLRHMDRAVFYQHRGYYSMHGDERIEWIPKLWNVEGDKIINADLIAHRLEMIEKGLIDPAVGRDDQLDENYVKAFLAQPPQPDQPGGEGEGEPQDDDESESEGTGSGTAGDQPEDQDDQSDGQDGDESKDDQEGTQSGQASDESDEEGQGSRSGDSDEQDAPPEPSAHGGFDDHFEPQYEGDDAELDREDDQNQVEQSIRDAVEQAEEMAKRMGQPPGTGSGIFGRALAEIDEAKHRVDWREELAEFITSRCGGGDPNWHRIHRRRYAMYGTLNPTPQGMLRNCGIVYDRSGSAHGIHNVFMSALAGLMNDLQPVEGITVIWTDTEVMSVDEVQTGDELLDLEAPMGGGTELSPALDWIDEQGRDFDVILCFTDGEMFESDMQRFADAGALLVLDRAPSSYYVKPMLDATEVRYIVIDSD